MKKTWIIAGALLVVAASAMEASAHGKGGGRQGGMGMGPGMGRGEGMVKGARVGLATQLGLSAEQQTQLDALKATLDEKEQALQAEEQTAFKALLTTEQQAALDAAAAAGRGHHRGPALNLSADQQTQLEALRTQYRDKHEVLHTEFQTAFEALLTADQKAKLAELRPAGPFGLCPGAGAEIGTSSTGTTTTGSTVSLSAAKAIASEDEPAAADQTISWGQLKSAE